VTPSGKKSDDESPADLVVEVHSSPRKILIEVLLAVVVLSALGVFLMGRSQPPVSSSAVPNILPSPTTSPVLGEKPGWKLTFADEFDGTTLDRAKWIDSYPDGKRTHANNEQQFYAEDGWQVADGKLSFTADRRNQGGMPYTSGMVCSYSKFAQQYGWFEIRAKFPKGQGLWPAFWLLPNSKDWPPEIDILEILGHETDVVLFSNHWGTDYRSHRYETKRWQGPDFATDFHTFAVEWTPEAIVWYVDSEERFRTTRNIPHEPMYVLANLAVGGILPGMPDSTTPFPSVMEVDYIRVYERQP
jgi:beta-glucanase (GH16 family)